MRPQPIDTDPPYSPGETVFIAETWGVEAERYIQPSNTPYGGWFENAPELPGIAWRSRKAIIKSIKPEQVEDEWFWRIELAEAET